MECSLLVFALVKAFISRCDVEENLKEKKAYVLFERTFFEVVLVARKCVNKML